MNEPTCPNCGSTNVSVRVVVFLDYTNGAPAFDPDDGDYAEPVDELDNAICRHCEQPFTVIP
jgi:hypothetical protein